MNSHETCARKNMDWPSDSSTSLQDQQLEKVIFHFWAISRWDRNMEGQVIIS